MSTPPVLNVIPLENPGAHTQTLNLRFRRLVSQQTNLSTEVNIMACLNDGFLQTKPVRPPYQGTPAERQNQEAEYFYFCIFSRVYLHFFENIARFKKLNQQIVYIFSSLIFS